MPCHAISVPGLAVVQRIAASTTEIVMKKPNHISAASRKKTTRKPQSTSNKPASAKPQCPSTHAKADTKLGSMITLLRRPEGASIAEMTISTGWQAHSVRGAMSGALKGKLGLNVTSEMKDGVRRYRIS
jgi:hypothetical protein